ncbi:MAG: carboxylase [Acidocella sp. 20-57-95]|nr:MAG: carboxylase [Acidocella sp. 20-57-95]OYV60693.1 MAG: carboxylase [Acidocella sp. 21-58-7]HQT64055.1 pyruvate carboxylase subunit B [Acidocella sp.]HQU04453.1 pyruvate carboxylase subunit B [Acidocella sp.]
MSAKNRQVGIIDVTLRDAHQCLWATRMTTAMMRDIAPRLDNAGFEAIDLVGGAVFDVAVRYLREDPWERMRILSQWVTKTPLIIHTRGQSLFTFEFFADDVVELAAERFAANGMRYHTPYDALNDMRNLEIPVKAAKRHGMYVAGGLVYTFSPVHTDEYYTKKAKELLALGVDTIFLKDASGLLTPERVATLVPAVKAVLGDKPLQIHTHCNSGLAPYVVLQAVEYGVDIVHTATSTLANGVSHSPTEKVVRNLRRRGYEVPLDLAPVDEAAELLAYIAAKEGKPVGAPNEYDDFHFLHQCPGGMVSNLAYQLETMGLRDRLEEILEEAWHVREDLGYPIVVSPFAQYIVTQSVLNVVGRSQGRARYDNVPDEIRLYVRGGYGEIAGPIDPNLYDKITRGAEKITERPGALVPPALERLRAARGPFASDDDLLLAAFYDDGNYRALKDAGPINIEYPIMATPLATLIKEISARPTIKYFHFKQGVA